MVKSWGVGGGWWVAHEILLSALGLGVVSILDSRFLILDSRFSILFPGSRSQVPGPRSQVPSPKSQSQSLDNYFRFNDIKMEATTSSGSVMEGNPQEPRWSPLGINTATSSPGSAMGDGNPPLLRLETPSTPSTSKGSVMVEGHLQSPPIISLWGLNSPSTRSKM